MYYFLDVETTGLNPRLDAILEVGIVVLHDNLRELARETWVVPYSQENMDSILHRTDDYVINMHTSNGLIAKCISTPVSRGQIEASMHLFLDTWGLTKDNPQPAVGNSVAFDRSFMQQYFPGVNERFHYRNVDISSFKFMFDKLGVMSLEEFAKNKIPSNHRVFNCLSESIREFKLIVQELIAPQL